MTDQIHSPRNIGNYSFRFICHINPERDQTGVVCAFLPQSSYKNFRRLKLHNCGSGPFCRFRIPSNLLLEGVYALVIGESVRYVGECIHLSKRFNMGYGQISPRNCFANLQIAVVGHFQFRLSVPNRINRFPTRYSEPASQVTTDSQPHYPRVVCPTVCAQTRWSLLSHRLYPQI